MKFKKLLILTGIVLVLSVLVIIKNSFQKKQGILERLAEPETVLVNNSMDVFVSKIIIYKGDDEKNKVILSKNDGKWILENKFGLKAKKEAIENFLASLKDLKGELRADSKSVFGDFQIQDNQAVHLILFGTNNQLLIHLLISFKSPNWRQNFIRVFDSNKIVLVNRNILSAIRLFDKTAKLDENYFADYRISPFDVDSVNKIELTTGEKRLLVLIKTLSSDKNSASVWNFESANNKSLLDLTKVNEYLQNVAGFYAQDILDPALKSYGFEFPKKVLKLNLLKNNKPEQIQIEVGSFIKDKKAYYVKLRPQDQVFIVSELSVNNLNRDKSYFTVKADKAKKK